MKGHFHIKMVDEATKKTVASIPTLKTKAGPRDSDAWVMRLKEEYTSLIKVCVLLLRYIIHSIYIGYKGTSQKLTCPV